MRFDQSEAFTAGFLLPPAAYDADNSPASFDNGTAQSATIALQVGAGGIVLALEEAHATPTVTLIGYKGRKRYLRLLADFSGTHGTATPMAAAVLRGNLDRIAPA